MSAKKILYLSQEIDPYVEGSPVGIVSRVFPQRMLENGYDIRTFMPNYGTINERRHQLHEVIRLSGMNLVVNDKVHQLVVKVATLSPARMQVYFIDNVDFFTRKGVLTDKQGELYKDNVERAIFFTRGVVETIKKLRWVPDIVHCQGWFAGLAPIYLRTLYKDEPSLSRAKIVLSVYDLTPEEPFGSEITEVLAFDKITDPILDGSPLTRDRLVDLILKYADGLIISSENISDTLRQTIDESGKKYLDYRELDQLVEASCDFYSSL